MAQVGKDVRFNSLRRLLLAELTQDNSTGITFGTAVPIGLQSELSFKPSFVTERLKFARGTAQVDQYIDFWTFQGKHGELSLDALALLLGGAPVAEAESVVGAGDSKQIWFHTAALKGKEFGIIGQPYTVAAGPADLYVCLLKCRITNLDPGKMGGGGWAEVTFSGEAAYTTKDQASIGIVALEKVTDQAFNVVVTDLTTYMAG